MGHSHHHHHEPRRTYGTAFAIGVSLNLAFVVVEAVYGTVAHSMALVADACHNLGDVLGLALAWGAATLARRLPSSRRTYGLRGTTIMASLVNALVLLFVTGGIAWESFKRIFEPERVSGATVIVVALVGVLVNGASAVLFMSGRKRDLNVRSAFVHLASDAGLALGVAVSGVVMMVTDLRWLDPVVSIALSLLIFGTTLSILRASLNLALAAVPEGVDPERVKAFLLGRPGVAEVHDLHIWALSTTETALTAHLVMPDGPAAPRFNQDTAEALHHEFDIDHATIQVDCGEPVPCSLAVDRPAHSH